MLSPQTQWFHDEDTAVAINILIVIRVSEAIECLRNLAVSLLANMKYPA